MIFVLTMIRNFVSFICFAKYRDALTSKSNGVILKREHFYPFEISRQGAVFSYVSCHFVSFFSNSFLFCVLFICGDGSSAGLRCIILTRSYSAKSISSSHQGSYYMSLWDVFLSDSGYPALKIHTALKIRLDGLKFSRTSPTSHICRNNLAFLQNLALSYNGLQNLALCCKIFHDIVNPCIM